MLPTRMTRILVGGHQDHMESTIQLLHAAKAVHLEDYDGEGLTTMGEPLPAGEEASELLVRARGILSALEAEDSSAKVVPAQNARQTLSEIEAAVMPTINKANELRTKLMAIETEQRNIAAFDGLDFDFADAGLRSVQAYIGTFRGDVKAELDAAGISYEAQVKPGPGGMVGAVFVAASDQQIAEQAVGAGGFTPLVIPSGTAGTPSERLATLSQSFADTSRELDAAEWELENLRNQHADLLCGLEKGLLQLADQTQAPLRFGVTATTFHLEGWVPASRLAGLQAKLNDQFGSRVYVEDLGDAPKGDHHHSEAIDEAPVQMNHKGLAKPMQYLLSLLGRPRYWEIDPTKLMLIFFPLFFGLMVGDLAVGLIIMLVGLYLKKNHVFGIGGPAIGKSLMMGGFMAAIVGGIVFGEALGIHFVVGDHELEEDELSWEALIYGKEAVLAGTAGFPHEGFIYKHAQESHAAASHGDATHGESTHGDTSHGSESAPAHSEPSFQLLAADAEETTAVNPLAPHGTTHLSFNGWFNLGYYSKVHDIQALLIMSVMLGFVHLVLGLVLGIRNVAKSHGVTLAIQEKVSWLIIIAGVAAVIFGLQGNQLLLAIGLGGSVVGLGLLWVGTAKVLGAGFVSILEVFGFVGNLLSYTRIAAIGASKAGMAIAFSSIGMVLSGGETDAIWWAMYIIGFALIIVLSILAGMLQSLRLQFVEFFGKFYQGGGRAFQPFGRR